MAEFVIVVATLASLAAGAPIEGSRSGPTLGFRIYPSVEACEAAVAQSTVRPGTRLVCLPVETPPSELASAH